MEDKKGGIEGIKEAEDRKWKGERFHDRKLFLMIHYYYYENAKL